MSLKQKTIYEPIFWTFLLCLFVGTCSIVYAANEDESTEEKSDLRFPIRNGNLDTYDELDKTYPIDLPDPDNIKTKIEYDPETGHFIYKKQVGNTDLSAPLELTADEYGKQQKHCGWGERKACFRHGCSRQYGRQLQEYCSVCFDL